MFELPHTVIKGGQLIVSEGELCECSVAGKTLCAAPEQDHDFDSVLSGWIENNYSVSHQSYRLGDWNRQRFEEVVCPDE